MQSTEQISFSLFLGRGQTDLIQDGMTLAHIAVSHTHLELLEIIATYSGDIFFAFFSFLKKSFSQTTVLLLYPTLIRLISKIEFGSQYFSVSLKEAPMSRMPLVGLLLPAHVMKVPRRFLSL